MKKVLSFIAVISLVSGTVTSALSQEVSPHRSLVEGLVSQIKTVLNADSVLGTPREFGTTRVVPIVCLALGFGYGGAGASVVREEGEGEGAGMGGGGIVSPTGLLVVKDNAVEVIAAKKGGLTVVMQEIIPAMVEVMRDRWGTPKPKQEKPAQ